MSHQRCDCHFEEPRAALRASFVRFIFWIIALATSPLAAAAAQQPAPPSPDELQKQLGQLKQQYETTTRDLQARIAALEQQIEKQKEASENAKQNTVSAVELAAEKAADKAVRGRSGQVGAQFQGQLPSEPTYDLLRE